MFFKSFGILLPLIFGGVYLSGGFSGYSRDVARPKAAVMAALADLDIRRQPGEPGTDPARSGGVRPLFRLERGPDSMTWVVMSGGQVATRMTARLEPIADGKTRVTASVDRGDAPDDFVSPAFRSESLTLGLFAMALDSELDRLTGGTPASEAECQALIEKLSGPPGPQTEAGFGGTAQAILKLSAMEGELKRHGCSTDRPAGEFTMATDRMSQGGSTPDSDPGVSFEPGKPMVDLSKRHK